MRPGTRGMTSRITRPCRRTARTMQEIDAELAALRRTRDQLQAQVQAIVPQAASYASRYGPPLPGARRCSHACGTCAALRAPAPARST